MSRILYFCPDFPQPSGGIKTLYRHAQRLKEMGSDAWIVHQKRPFQVTWHGYEAPTIWLSDRPQFTPRDVLVIPEVMPQIMQQTARFAGERIVIALSWSPTYWNLPAGQTWRSFGIERVITKSPLIQEYLRWSMGIEATLISEYVNESRYRFAPDQKRPKVCYLTRKERSAAWLHSILFAKGPPFTEFEWMPLRGLSEDEYARHLRQATVYVSTNMQEGMNTSVLEAMACGCLVVGYSGIGGVYMRRRRHGPELHSGGERKRPRARGAAGAGPSRNCRRPGRLRSGHRERTADGRRLPESRQRGGQPAGGLWPARCIASGLAFPRQPLLAQRKPLHCVADANCTALHDPGSDAAVAAHGVVAARAEILLHAAARVAGPAVLEDRCADAKAPVLEAEQVDAAHDDVASRQRGIRRGAAQECSDRVEVLALDQGDLAFAVALPVKVIALETAAGHGFDRIHRLRLAAPRRTHTNPRNRPVS